MKKLTRISKAAEAGLFVVFADVRGEVCYGDCADVGGGFDGADGLGGGVGVFGDEGGVRGEAFVVAVVGGLGGEGLGGGLFGGFASGTEEGFLVVPV